MPGYIAANKKPKVMKPKKSSKKKVMKPVKKSSNKNSKKQGNKNKSKGKKVGGFIRDGSPQNFHNLKMSIGEKKN
jgi:hypothetical protein